VQRRSANERLIPAHERAESLNAVDQSFPFENIHGLTDHDARDAVSLRQLLLRREAITGAENALNDTVTRDRSVSAAPDGIATTPATAVDQKKAF